MFSASPWLICIWYKTPETFITVSKSKRITKVRVRLCKLKKYQAYQWGCRPVTLLLILKLDYSALPNWETLVLSTWSILCACACVFVFSFHCWRVSTECLLKRRKGQIILAFCRTQLTLVIQSWNRRCLFCVHLQLLHAGHAIQHPELPGVWLTAWKL